MTTTSLMPTDSTTATPVVPVVLRTSPQPTAREPMVEQALTTLDVAEAGLQALERDLDACPPALVAPRPIRTTLQVSVVVPVFNECGTIREIVGRIRAAAMHTEIVLVDDCSTDGTRDVLLELAREPDIRVLLHGYNKGKGAALRTAFQEITGNVVLIQDADLEYDPTDYAKLLAPIERGDADVVFGSRFLENPEQDPSWLHRFGNRLLTWASNRCTGLRLTDMETCYKVFRRGVLLGMPLRENRFGFEPEFTAKLARRKCRVREVPVSYRSRGPAEGKKIGLADAWRALYCIVRYALCD